MTEAKLAEIRKTERECGAAWAILTHWVESARAIGNEPLTEVMENALREVSRLGWRAQQELEAAESKSSSSSSLG